MDELTVGDTVGPYRLDESLGRGGMGQVFRAFDTTRERKVALKLLRPELSLDDEFSARFEREARLASRLSDPHVIPIHDFGRIDNRLFIDMRLVEGTDLAAEIEQGPLSLHSAADIINQVASALDAAHDNGLLHRDVKPGNVLLNNHRGRHFAYLTDFGVAVEAGRTEKNLTATGAVVGTIGYLAPEIFSGDGWHRGADVYALGCMLYEMLVGKQPFPSSSLPTVMYSHLSTPPPRASLDRADVPVALDDVILRGMAKDPTTRFATAGDLGRAALAALEGQVSDIAAAVQPASALPLGTQPSPRPVPVAPPAASAPQPSQSTKTTADAASAHRYDVTTVTRPPQRRPFDLLPPRTGRIPLRPDYQAVAGPLQHTSAIPFLNNQPFVDAVKQRLRYSAGGSLLVTGLNGVGKTTVVRRAIDELRRELSTHSDEDTPVIEVWHSVARPTTPDEMIVRLLRGLAESIHRAGVLPRLAADVEDMLQMAYRRTLMTVKSTRSDATERSLGLTGALGGLSGNLGAKRTRTRGSEEEYLPYTLVDAEHDFIRIVSALAQGVEPRRSAIRRLLNLDVKPWSGRLVIVLDEIDKLTSDPEGLSSLESLLRGLKNVLTASAAHFVFIAGADVCELGRHSHARGNTIWSSVFGRQIYLNCLSPGAANVLLRHLLLGTTGRGPSEVADYLEYRSRGLPRHLLNELDELVEWHSDGPHIAIDHTRATTIAFFASLQRRLGPLWAQARPQGPLTHSIDIDSRRDATYLVVNWALSRHGAPFTTADFLTARAAKEARVDLASDSECVGLLRELAEVGILDTKKPNSPDHTVVGKERVTETTYELARAIVDSVRVRSDDSVDLGRVDGGRYVLLEEIGRGPLGKMFRARDTFTSRDVAIKLLDIHASIDKDLVNRFQREVDIARRLDHPLLATVLGVVEEDGRLALVSEFVVGQSLAAMLTRGPLYPPFSARLTMALVELLRYLDDENVFRLGLKPSNIIVTPRGRPVLVELGLARRADEKPLTSAGMMVGTPLYLAPEQLEYGKVNISSDLYALGLVMYEMLSGRAARQGSTPAVVASLASERVDVNVLPCSPQLRSLLAWLLEPNPADRCPDPGSFAAYLASTPEMWA